jgi:Family of unknown function (DUF6526)
MADTKPQDLKNHTKLDPSFHFFLAPLGLILLINAIVEAVKNPGTPAYLNVVIILWIFIAVFKMRVYSLKVQDRLIRLEERIRMAKLLPDALNSRALANLTEGQYIALRFASDGELAGLVQKTLDGNLNGKQIKAAIQTWRPDHFRV